MSEELIPTISPGEDGDTSVPSPQEADLDAVRALILALHPDIVPDLIGGDSVAALIASIAPAQEAYGRIAASVRVPAGGNPTFVLDADSLPTSEKIRRGLVMHGARP